MDETFQLGEFTVRVRMRQDNPAFPQYVIYRSDEFVGRSFSRPSIDDARWLLRQNIEGTIYASVTTYTKQPARGNALKKHQRKVSP